MSPARWLVVLLLASGCQDIASFQPPTETGEMVLFVVEPPAGEPLVWAIDTPEDPFPSVWSLGEGSKLTAVVYSWDPGELFIETGLVPVRREGEPSRPIPSPDAAFTSVVSADGQSPWSEVDLSDLNLRIPPLPDGASDTCWEQDGCTRVLDDTSSACLVPCPRTVVEPPILPEPVDFPETCRSGWVKETIAGHEICAPPPPPSSPCPFDQTQWIDSADCTMIGDPCGASDFPNIPPGRSVYYVLAGASGTGTEQDPFGTIQEAIAAAAPDGIVAIGKGTYDALDLDLRSALGLTLWGACTGQTILHFDSQVVLAATERVEVRNIAIEAEKAFLVGPGAATLQLVDVLLTAPIDGQEIELIKAAGGAQIGLSSVVTRRFQGASQQGENAVAIYLQDGAGARITNCVFAEGSRDRSFGVVVKESATASISDTAFRGIGLPLRFWSGSRGVLSRVLVDDWHEVAILIASAQVHSTDLFTRSAPTCMFSGCNRNGVWAYSGGTLTATRSVILGFTQRGILAGENESGGTVVATDTVLVPGDADRDYDDDTVHLLILVRSSVSFSRLLTAGTVTRPLSLDGEVYITDATIVGASRDCLRFATTRNKYVDRVRVSDCQWSGATFWALSAGATLRNATIENSVRGIVVDSDNSTIREKDVTLERIRIVGSLESGMIVGKSLTVLATDLEIEGTGKTGTCGTCPAAGECSGCQRVERVDEPGSAVFIESLATLFATRFRFATSARAAVDTSRSSFFHGERGGIVSNEVGWYGTPENHPIRDLSEVRVQDNGENFELVKPK